MLAIARPGVIRRQTHKLDFHAKCSIVSPPRQQIPPHLPVAQAPGGQVSSIYISYIYKGHL